MSQNIHRPVDWEQLVNENENHLYRAALAILRDVHEAEDAVQDAFVKYLEKAPDQLENPAAWLMRVLVNGCKSRLRRAGRRELPLLDTIPAPEPEERPVLEAVLALPPHGPGGDPPVLLRGVFGPGDRPHHRPVAGDGALPPVPGQGKTASYAVGRWVF